jgi:predicted PurR-regulated permease PerM
MASAKTARAVLIVLVIVAVALLALIAYPFAGALFIGAVLAGAFDPWQERLARRLGGRREAAAALVTLGMILTLLLPLTWLAIFIGGEVVDGVDYVRTTLQSEGVAGLVNDLPAPIADLVRRGLERLPQSGAQLQEFAGRQSGRAAALMGGLLRATGGVLMQTVMMLIAFFFLLVDGPRLVDWLSRVAPLRPGQMQELLGEFRKVSVAVLVSSIATAGIQAAVALVGYLLARAPQPFFFAFLTFIFAFVPAIGAGSVAVVLAILVYATGQPKAALFLALWGVVVVGFSDNLVKPLLMKGRMEIHGGVIFFALLGGLAAFGAVGLLAGPLIVAFFLAVVRMSQREFGEN